MVFGAAVEDGRVGAAAVVETRRGAAAAAAAAEVVGAAAMVEVTGAEETFAGPAIRAVSSGGAPTTHSQGFPRAPRRPSCRLARSPPAPPAPSAPVGSWARASGGFPSPCSPGSTSAPPPPSR